MTDKKVGPISSSPTSRDPRGNLKRQNPPPPDPDLSKRENPPPHRDLFKTLVLGNGEGKKENSGEQREELTIQLNVNLSLYELSNFLCSQKEKGKIGRTLDIYDDHSIPFLGLKLEFDNGIITINHRKNQIDAVNNLINILTKEGYLEE